MAKKKHKKKHSFQHKNVNTSAAAAPTTPVIAPAKGVPKARPATMPNEWGEVRADVRKTLVLGFVFIMVMIGLWVVLEYTALGSNLYNSIKL
jgi:hypothetical protein